MVGQALVYNSYDLKDEVQETYMFSYTFALDDRVLVYNSYHLNDDDQHSRMFLCICNVTSRVLVVNRSTGALLVNVYIHILCVCVSFFLPDGFSDP